MFLSDDAKQLDEVPSALNTLEFNGGELSDSPRRSWFDFNGG